MKIKIEPIPAFTDNYIWAIHNSQNAILVDPGQAEPAKFFLKKNNLKLTGILITHHHYDHIDGVMDLCQSHPCDIYGPEDNRINFNYIKVKEKDLLHFSELGIELQVLETPGHTLSHICYFNEQWLFCGDTLFSIGCGRMFEGTPEQYVNSLNKLKTLVNSTYVFCSHEYTSDNLKFALSLEPINSELLEYQEEVNSLRQANKPSLPTILQMEKRLNPFLRTHETTVQSIIGKLTDNDIKDEIECFAAMRHLKDIF